LGEYYLSGYLYYYRERGARKIFEKKLSWGQAISLFGKETTGKIFPTVVILTSRGKLNLLKGGESRVLRAYIREVTKQRTPQWEVPAGVMGAKKPLVGGLSQERAMKVPHQLGDLSALKTERCGSKGKEEKDATVRKRYSGIGEKDPRKKSRQRGSNEVERSHPEV